MGELMDMALALPPQLLHTLLPQLLLLLQLLLPPQLLELMDMALALPLQPLHTLLPQLLMQQPALLTALLCGNLDVTRTQQIKQTFLLIKPYYKMFKVIYYYYNIASLSYPYLST